MDVKFAQSNSRRPFSLVQAFISGYEIRQGTGTCVFQTPDKVCFSISLRSCPAEHYGERAIISTMKTLLP